MPRFCEFIGCHINPNYAKAGEKRKRCKEHIQEGDVDVTSRKCEFIGCNICLLYTSPSPRDGLLSRMPSSA